LYITHENKKLANTRIWNTKFLGIPLDDTFFWNTHIDMIIPQLSSACLAIREFWLFLTQESLKMVNYCNFHSVMMYGIMYWGKLLL